MDNTETEKKTARRPRVVLLLQDLKFGGTQRQALELAKRLDPARFEVMVWLLMGGEDFIPQAREYGLRVVRLGMGSYVWPPALWRLWRQLKLSRPDILLLLTGIPNIWGRIFGWLRRVPVIIGGCRQRRNPRQQHEWLLKRLAGHHICNAHSLKKLLVDTYAIPEKNVSVIHNGVDAGHFIPAPNPPPNTEKRVLCMGRLVVNKDHDTLLAAFERVLRSEPDARLTIVGDGHRRDALAKRIGERFPKGAVDLLPGTPDTVPLFQNSQVFALSSIREGLPNVILEAMACGLPVAATAVDGVPELVEHGITGLLSPAREPNALADNLLTLLGDSELRKNMGNAARARVEESFSYEAMAQAFEETFSRLLAEKNKGTPWPG